MENNLYNRLHKYTDRWDENFLTQALSHLLCYLQKNDQEACTSILAYLTGDLIGKSDLPDLEISSQFRLPSGKIPDMCFWHPRFLILLEVKIDDSIREGQLEPYRNHLDSQSGINEKKLVTLTRYNERQDHPEVDISIRWSRLARHLRRVKPDQPVGRYLTEQFVDFLKIRGLEMRKINRDLVKGIEARRYLKTMIGEALNYIERGEHPKKQTGIGNEFVGEYRMFNVNDQKLKIWFGLTYDEPDELHVMLEGLDLDRKLEPNFGEITSYGHWRTRLSLDSKQVQFFDQPNPEKQLEIIIDFFKSSIDAALDFFQNEQY